MTKGIENYKYCDSYEEKEEIIGWHGPYEPITRCVGRCNGTRERDICSCKGNRFKCDFYEYVREDTKNNRQVSKTNEVDVPSCYPGDVLKLKLNTPTPTLNYTYIFTDNDNVSYEISAKSKKDAVGIFNKKYGIPFWFIRKYFTIKKEK